MPNTGTKMMTTTQVNRVTGSKSSLVNVPPSANSQQIPYKATTSRGISPSVFTAKKGRNDISIFYRGTSTDASSWSMIRSIGVPSISVSG